jgi:hypothetical protein
MESPSDPGRRPAERSSDAVTRATSASASRCCGGLGERLPVSGVLRRPVVAVGDRLHKVLKAARFDDRDASSDVDGAVALGPEPEASSRGRAGIALSQSLCAALRSLGVMRGHVSEYARGHAAERVRRCVIGGSKHESLG